MNNIQLAYFLACMQCFNSPHFKPLNRMDMAEWNSVYAFHLAQLNTMSPTTKGTLF